MKKILLPMLALLVLSTFPSGVQAFFLSNGTVIQPTAAETTFFIVSYYNLTTFTFPGQPAEAIVIDGRILKAEAGEAMNITVLNYTVATNELLITNTTATPTLFINASGFTASYLIDVVINGTYNQQATANASGWANFNITGFEAEQILVTFNQTAAADSDPPIFTNIINHTHPGNTSFTYDVDATDVTGLDSFTINETNFSIDITTGVITNATPTNITRLYWINITVNDTLGNLNWTVFYINITQEPEDVYKGRMFSLLFSDISSTGGQCSQDFTALMSFSYILMPVKADADTIDRELYESTDLDVLVYRDSDGVVNELYGNHIYGEMWNRTNADNPFVFPIPAVGVYYNLTNLTTGSLNGFTFTANDTSQGGSYLTANSAGRYRVTSSISSIIGAASGDLYGYAISHNFERAGHNNCYARRTAVNKVGNVGITCFMDMAAGDHVNIQIEQESGGVARDVALHTVNLNLVRVGE